MSPPKVLVVDNFDSFTFTLVDYLRSLGAEVRVERNVAISVADALAPENGAIVISPGPGTPEEAGISVELARACVQRQRPLLGVCLGHQAIALACGSAVARAAPVHGKTSCVRHDGSGLFRNLATPMVVTRYHSLAVPAPVPPLVVNAWSDDGLVMAMRHLAAPIYGVQFHPESVASEYGHALLANFLGMAAEIASRQAA